MGPRVHSPPLAWSHGSKAATGTAGDDSIAVLADPPPRARVEGIVAPLAIFAAAAVCHVVAIWPTSRDHHLAISALLMRWDSGWYVALAKHGYPHHLPPVGHMQSTAGFYPLYPLLERLAMHVTPFGDHVIALGIAMVSSALAMIVLWHLTARLCDTSTATRAVALTAFAPGAIVLSMGYSEGLMILFATLTLLLLLDERWLLAGVCAALACLARPSGIAAAAACLVAAIVAVRADRRDLRPLVAPALAALGAIALPLYDQVHIHDALAYYKTQKHGWGQGFDGGISTLRNFWHFAHHPFRDFNQFFAVLALAVLVGGIVLLVQWRPPAPVLAYAIVIAVLTLGASEFVSTFRMILVGIPFTIAYARVLKRSDVFAVTLAVSAVLFATLATAAATATLYTP